MFCQLDLLFFHVLVAVAVVVCLRSLITSFCYLMELMKLRENELVGTNFLEDFQEFVRILYTELNGKIGGGKLSNSLFSETLLPALAIPVASTPFLLHR